jgi:hypothetical protein
VAAKGEGLDCMGWTRDEINQISRDGLQRNTDHNATAATYLRMYTRWLSLQWL